MHICRGECCSCICEPAPLPLHVHTPTPYSCGCRFFVSTAKGIVTAFKRAEMRRRLAFCFPRLLGVGPAHYAHLADRAYWCHKYAKANAVSVQHSGLMLGMQGIQGV